MTNILSLDKMHSIAAAGEDIVFERRPESGIDRRAFFRSSGTEDFEKSCALPGIKRVIEGKSFTALFLSGKEIDGRGEEFLDSHASESPYDSHYEAAEKGNVIASRSGLTDNTHRLNNGCAYKSYLEDCWNRFEDR